MVAGQQQPCRRQHFGQPPQLVRKLVGFDETGQLSGDGNSFCSSSSLVTFDLCGGFLSLTAGTQVDLNRMQPTGLPFAAVVVASFATAYFSVPAHGADVALQNA